jgi:phosphate-selective porin OprO and OprP
MRHKSNWVAGIACMACVAGNSGFAAAGPEAFYPVSSAGPQAQLEVKPGIAAKVLEDDTYWFTSGGVLRLDGGIFMGSANSKQTNYPNGALIRAAEWSFNGGLEQDLSYVLRLKLDLPSRVRLTDAALNYGGIAPNALLSLGRLNSPFSLDNENSTSWQPFIESATISVFFPNPGIGLKYGMWWDHFAFKVAVLQADHGSITPPPSRHSNPVQASGRAFYAPVNRPGDIYHFGAGAVYREVINQTNSGGDIKRFTMDAYPGARARRTSTLVQLVEPGLQYGGDTSDVGMRASVVRQLNVEAAREYGPWLVFGEYFFMHVKRPQPTPSGLPPKKNVRFRGWFLVGSWLLTGESRQYTMADGEFSTIKPNHSYGAWEVAARYTYVNLTDRDIIGGSQHDAGLALNWFYNAHVRFSINYIHALVRPAIIYTGSLRKLDIIAGRVQVRW